MQFTGPVNLGAWSCCSCNCVLTYYGDKGKLKLTAEKAPDQKCYAQKTARLSALGGATQYLGREGDTYFNAAGEAAWKTVYWVSSSRSSQLGTLTESNLPAKIALPGWRREGASLGDMAPRTPTCFNPFNRACYQRVLSG